MDVWRQISPGGSHLPTPRSGHSVVACSDKCMLLSGGQTTGSNRDDAIDFWCLQLMATGKPLWRQVSVSGSSPCSRWGHTMTMLSGGTLLLFGGRDSQHVYGDTWLVLTGMILSQGELEIGEGESTGHGLHGGSPSAGFGGPAPLHKGDVGSEVRCIGVERSSDDPPGCRCSHSAVDAFGSVVVFGGLTFTSAGSEGAAAAVDVLASSEAGQSDQGHLLSDTFVYSEGGWREAETDGQPPCARMNHAACVVGAAACAARMVVIGGYSSIPCVGSVSPCVLLHDVHILSLGQQAGASSGLSVAQWTWTQPVVTGSPPRPWPAASTQSLSSGSAGGGSLHLHRLSVLPLSEIAPAHLSRLQAKKKEEEKEEDGFNDCSWALRRMASKIAQPRGGVRRVPSMIVLGSPAPGRSSSSSAEDDGMPQGSAVMILGQQENEGGVQQHGEEIKLTWSSGESILSPFQRGSTLDPMEVTMSVPAVRLGSAFVALPSLSSVVDEGGTGASRASTVFQVSGLPSTTLDCGDRRMWSLTLPSVLFWDRERVIWIGHHLRESMFNRLTPDLVEYIVNCHNRTCVHDLN